MGDWRDSYKDLGGLVGEVERLDFSNPTLVLDLFRDQGKRLNYTLKVQTTLKLAKSSSKVEFVAQLVELIKQTLERGDAGITGLVQLWENANDYDIESWAPDAPAVMRLIGESIELFTLIHEFHGPDHQSRGNLLRDNVSEAEAFLVDVISRLIKPSYDGFDESAGRMRYTHPDVEMQERILDFLLYFEAIGEHSPHNLTNAVRQQMQQLAIELVARESYDLALVHRLWAEYSNAGREVLGRGLVKRIGRDALLDTYFEKFGDQLPT